MKKEDRKKIVLFVCTGNSCRSVIAQTLFKKIIFEKGLDDKIEVLSAGTAAPRGLKPTKGTIKVLQREGIDISEYRSQKLTAEILKVADLVVVMEKRHRYNLIELYPQKSDKIFLINI